MKKLLLIISLLSTSLLWADTTDSKSIWFDGDVRTESVSMQTEKTRTEYRTVTVPSTCYRTEWRYRCTPRHRTCRNVCHPQRGCRRVCSGGGSYCRNVPVQVPYRCQRQVREPYEVLDYYVNTDVTFNYDLSDILSGAAEEFIVKVTGKDISLKANDSGNYLILKKEEDINADRDGDTLNQSITYDFDFVQMSKIREALGNGVQDVLYQDGELSFVLGKSFNTKDFIQNIKVFNSRRFRSDVLVFDRNLTDSEMQVSTVGDNKKVVINLRGLGINLPSRMRVIMTTKYNTQGAETLNANSSELEASANWIFSK